MIAGDGESRAKKSMNCVLGTWNPVWFSNRADLSVKYQGYGQRNSKLVGNLGKITSKFIFNIYYPI